MKNVPLSWLLFLFFFSCNAQSEFDSHTTPFAEIRGDEIILIVEEEVIINSVKSKDTTITQVLNIRVERENSFSYLLFEIEKEELTIPYAIQLNPESPGSLMLVPNGTTHSCSGYCCESCRFTKNTSGAITGCWCYRAAPTTGCQTTAKCDHSISSTSGNTL
ncbi:MAG: hypothetical protein K8R58_07370 [Bacteroidales bacterium]|nr:hypothetical protein [Bacteroidales bacterium]